MGGKRQGGIRRSRSQGRRGREAGAIAGRALATMGKVRRAATWRLAATPGQIALALAIALFLALFLVVPVADGRLRCLHREGHRRLHAGQFLDFARTDLFITSFWNSMYVVGDDGGPRLDVRAAARLSDDALRIPRRRRRADAGLHSADHAAVCRRGCDAAAVRPQRHGQSAARRLVRLQDPVHGGPERRRLRAGRALLPVHPDQSVGGAAQYRPLDGGGRAEPRLPRVSGCFAASCFRWRCRATSPAPAWCSSRCSTISRRRCC